MEQSERESRWAMWMRAAMAGDETSYRQLLAALAVYLRPRVRQKLARCNCGDVDVEDIVQETLLAIHLKRHTWRQDELLSPWIAVISRNKLIDVLRRRGRRSEIPLDETPEEWLEAQATGDAGDGADLARVLSSLGDRQQRIVQLVSLEGHSARAAAAELGMSEGALRVALHRALRTLADRWRSRT